MGRLAEELKRLGDVGLKAFIAASGADLTDIYRSGRSWTSLRRRVGFDRSAEGPSESILVSAIGRMLHVEDDLRLATWTTLVRDLPTDVSDVDPRVVAMLYVNLWGADRKGDSDPAAFARLAQHPSIRSELLELFDILDEQSHVLGRRLAAIHDFPLVLGARYTQNEALAAIGASSAGSPRRIREGVYFDRATETNLLFVTLQKADTDYSPTTRYRDYAISPNLFHWESQSTTASDSPTGKRYQSRSARPLLFVRATKRNDQREANPYTYLGPVEYLSHEGERPMTIRWRLAHDMPVELFEYAALVAV